MRQRRSRRLVWILAGSILAAGCGEAATSVVPFKPTDTSNLDSMKDAMTKNLKTKNYVNRAAK